MKIVCTVFLFFIHMFCMCGIAYGQDPSRDSIEIILQEAYERDQAPRRTIDSLMRAGEVDGNKYLPAIEQQQQADSLNLVVVLPLIDMIYEYHMYDLDPGAYKTCWTIIQHAPDDVMHKYEDFVKQLVVNKLISVESYMAYVDRCKVRQSKAQIYGWQFKRFSNGLTIQFPILKGFEERWNELGLEYKERYLMPEEYNVQYDYKTTIDERQFAILVVVSDDRSDEIRDEVSISINSKEITGSESTGFFKVIVCKEELPVTLKVATKDVSKEYRVEQNDEIDYIFLNCVVDNNTIDIMSE